MSDKGVIKNGRGVRTKSFGVQDKPPSRIIGTNTFSKQNKNNEVQIIWSKVICVFQLLISIERFNQPVKKSLVVKDKLSFSFFNFLIIVV